MRDGCCFPWQVRICLPDSQPPLAPASPQETGAQSQMWDNEGPWARPTSYTFSERKGLRRPGAGCMTPGDIAQPITSRGKRFRVLGAGSSGGDSNIPRSVGSPTSLREEFPGFPLLGEDSGRVENSQEEGFWQTLRTSRLPCCRPGRTPGSQLMLYPKLTKPLHSCPPSPSLHR